MSATRAWILGGGLLLAVSGTAAEPVDPDSPQGAWERLTEVFRKRPLGEGSTRALVSIEAAGRRDPYLWPAIGEAGPVQTTLLRAKKKTRKGAGKGPATAGRSGGPLKGDKARETLDRMKTVVAEAEQTFERGAEERAAKLLEKKTVEGWEKTLFEAPADITERDGYLVRAKTVLGRVEARREFRQRGYQLNFVVYHQTEPKRSVASISGNLVRAGGVFEDGVELAELSKDRVTLKFRGETFELSLAKR